jgi:SMC interacting uncharacterized protein involved in chromosome segregation
VLHRDLSNDWTHARELVAEVSLTHNQFAELITSPNRGDGVPCTLNYVAEPGSKLQAVPGITKIKSKADVFRAEIKESSKKQIQSLQAQIDALGAAIEAGTTSKKQLREMHHSMVCAAGNLPSNMEFVVSQAEEALEKAVVSAKTDIEAYIGHAINRLGIDAANSIGLTSNVTVGFLENDINSIPE